MAAVAPHPLVAVLLLSLCLAAEQFTDAIYWAATIAVAGRRASAACGLMNTGGNLLGGVGALLYPSRGPVRLAGRAGEGTAVRVAGGRALAGHVGRRAMDHSAEARRHGHCLAPGGRDSAVQHPAHHRPRLRDDSRQVRRIPEALGVQLVHVFRAAGRPRTTPAPHHLQSADRRAVAGRPVSFA